MRSNHRSILLTPLVLLMAAASLAAQTPQSQEPATRTITLKLENTAHCDADVRIMQDGRAVVSRATVTQLGSKTLSVEVSDQSNLIVHVKGRQCNIGYTIDVPVFRGNTLTFEVADTPQMAVARR